MSQYSESVKKVAVDVVNELAAREQVIESQMRVSSYFCPNNDIPVTFVCQPIDKIEV